VEIDYDGGVLVERRGMIERLWTYTGGMPCTYTTIAVIVVYGFQYLSGMLYDEVASRV